MTKMIRANYPYKSRPAPKPLRKKREPVYTWEGPKPLSMNVYLLEEEDILQMLLMDRKVKAFKEGLRR